MKKIVLTFLTIITFIILPHNVHADNIDYEDMSLKFNETLNFNFIIANVDELSHYELLEGIKVELNDGEFTGLSNERGIVTFENVPIKYTKIKVYDELEELIFTKHVIFSFGDRNNGYKYNSTAHETEEILNIGLGYDEDDIKNGNIRMDIHIREDEHSAYIFMATRMLGEGDNSNHLFIVALFAVALITFIILYEKTMQIIEAKRL